MSKLTAMLKWAMRIVAVGGALLAMAVGTAAWMHRTQGCVWIASKPTFYSYLIISPEYLHGWGWMRRDMDMGVDTDTGRFGVVSWPWTNSHTEPDLRAMMQRGRFGVEWHGFGVVRGDGSARPSFTAFLSPTWAVITAVLLLPTGLWAGIGWRQRRRVMAGHCANCGYDLRATTDRCPECGKAV